MLKDMRSRPDGAIPASKVPAIAAAVRAACDAQDGVTDGVVNDPRTCRFDPATMACKAGDASDCLLPGQVATLKTIYAPKVDAHGKEILPEFLPGGEDGGNGWAAWITGTPKAKSLAEEWSVGFQVNLCMRTGRGPSSDSMQRRI
jgi:hypothetical protein